MKKMVINIFLLSTLISFIILMSINVSWTAYGFIFIVQIIFLFLNIKFKPNKEFFLKVVSINIGFFIVYCLKNIYINGALCQNTIEYTFFNLILVSIIVLSCFLILNRRSKGTIEENDQLVIPKRTEDLNRLKNYLEAFEIVGLNGEWGSGKTFLINELKKEIKGQYEFIEIDLLTCNLNEMQLTLVNSLEELLLAKGIIPRSASKIKRKISSIPVLSRFMDGLNIVFSNKESQADTLKILIEDTKKLDKKTLIIYEDIDRIENTAVLKEILAISERLVNERTKVIYQYDESLLIDRELNYEYIEKYIPYKMNLTKLHLVEVIQFELKNEYSDILAPNDFSFLKLQQTKFNVLTEFFDMEKEYYLNIDYISYRKVQHMLMEIHTTLKKKVELQTEYKELVIAFFIVKHFFPEMYSKLNVKETIFESLSFEYNDKAYTILDLVYFHESKKENSLHEISEIFKLEENQVAYGVLKLLNFDLIFKEGISEQRYIQMKRDLEFKHEKKNRVIWKLLYEGKSIATDFELAVERMCTEVLDETKDNQVNAFRRYMEHYYYAEKEILDNNTIFKLGVGQFESLYEAFKVVGTAEEYQMKLNTFYFEQRGTKEIDLALLKCMNYFPLKTDKEYLQVIMYFNQQQVSCNFNKVSDFFFFVTKYIRAIGDVKLMNSYKHYEKVGLEDKIDFNNEVSYIKFSVKRMREEIGERRKNFVYLNLNQFISILDVIERFLEKIIEIIEFPISCQNQRSSSVLTEFTSRHVNQEEYERLKGIIDSGISSKEIKSLVENSYESGKITFYELSKILEGIN